jgi:hypothetical protein
MVTVRLLAGWLRQVRVAFGLPAASPGGLWAAILAGQRGGRLIPFGISNHQASGGDSPLFRLVELHQHFDGRQRGPQLSLVMGVAAGERRPGDMAELLELHQGLRDIRELQRRGWRHDHRVPTP